VVALPSDSAVLQLTEIPSKPAGASAVDATPWSCGHALNRKPNVSCRPGERRDGSLSACFTASWRYGRAGAVGERLHCPLNNRRKGAIRPSRDWRSRGGSSGRRPRRGSHGESSPGRSGMGRRAVSAGTPGAGDSMPVKPLGGGRLGEVWPPRLRVPRAPVRCPFCSALLVPTERDVPKPYV
jgi:hypothetical protein